MGVDIREDIAFADSSGVLTMGALVRVARHVEVVHLVGLALLYSPESGKLAFYLTSVLVIVANIVLSVNHITVE